MRALEFSRVADSLKYSVVSVTSFDGGGRKTEASRWKLESCPGLGTPQNCPLGCCRPFVSLPWTVISKPHNLIAAYCWKLMLHLY